MKKQEQEGLKAAEANKATVKTETFKPIAEPVLIESKEPSGGDLTD